MGGTIPVTNRVTGVDNLNKYKSLSVIPTRLTQKAPGQCLSGGSGKPS